MSENSKMKQLLDFLDKKALDPILNKSGSDFNSEDQKRKFHDVDIKGRIYEKEK
jgi:hypothetical protein